VLQGVSNFVVSKFWGICLRRDAHVIVQTLHILNDPATFQVVPGSPEYRRAAAALRTEAYLLSRLQGTEHVIGYRGVVLDADGDVRWLVMEKAQESLESLLKRQRLSRWQLWQLAEQMCRALVLCHARGIIHRDLKPSNVLVMASGGGTLRVKLCDVGNGKAALSTFTPGMGASFYLAPDALVASPYTAKIDVFSFGVVLAELVVVALPVSGCALDATATTYATNRFGLVAEACRRLELPVCGDAEKSWRQLADVIRACTADTAEVRCSSARALELLTELQWSALVCPECGDEFSRSKQPMRFAACGHHVCTQCQVAVAMDHDDVCECRVCGPGASTDSSTDVAFVRDVVTRVRSPWLSLPPLSADDELVFVMLGRTGQGKSTTACKLLQYDPSKWYDVATGEVSVVQAAPGDGDTSRQLGFPFESLDNADRSVTPAVKVFNRRAWMEARALAAAEAPAHAGAGAGAGGGAGTAGCAAVWPNVTVADTPGFGDKRSAADIAMSDPGICLGVCQAMTEPSPTEGATALLLFFDSKRHDTTLNKQLVLLQHFFGDEVWNRLLFVRQSESCTERERAHAAAVVSSAMASLSERLGRVVGPTDGRVYYPVLLGKKDSCDVVLGKVRWALYRQSIPTNERLGFTFAPSSCRKCGATADRRMLAALRECGVEVNDALGKCHEKMMKKKSGDSVPETVGSVLCSPFALVVGPVTGVLGAVSGGEPVPLMLQGFMLPFKCLTGQLNVRYHAHCKSCDAPAGTPGCVSVGAQVEHQWDGPSLQLPQSEDTGMHSSELEALGLP
jgi:serine/threonine protein kinase